MLHHAVLLRIRWLLLILLIAALCLTTWVWSPTYADKTVPFTLESWLQDLQDGDLLFINNPGMWGEIAKQFSPNDTRFSHVGIFFWHQGQGMVVHADGDPIDPQGRVKIDPIDVFVRRANHVGWFQWDLPAEFQRSLVQQSLLYVAQGYRFNQQFRLGRPHELYCTELIWRAMLDAQQFELLPNKRQVWNRPIIGLDDLTTHPQLMEVAGWSARSGWY